MQNDTLSIYTCYGSIAFICLFFRWALSTAVLIMLAFMSYLTTTFMIEAMASANAMLNYKRSQIIKRSESITHDDLHNEATTSDSDAQQNDASSRTGIIRLEQCFKTF